MVRGLSMDRTDSYTIVIQIVIFSFIPVYIGGKLHERKRGRMSRNILLLKSQMLKNIEWLGQESVTNRQLQNEKHYEYERSPCRFTCPLYPLVVVILLPI